MVRVKDIYNASKRTKSILLSEKAFLLLKEYTKAHPRFNFSRWVTEKICRHFGATDENYWGELIKDLRTRKSLVLEQMDADIDHAVNKWRESKKEAHEMKKAEGINDGSEKNN